MPLNQKGRKVFAGTGSGYTESSLNGKAVASRKKKAEKEVAAKKQAAKKRNQRKPIGHAAKLRSPRI